MSEWKKKYLKATFEIEKDNDPFWKEMTKRCHTLHQKVFKQEFFVNGDTPINKNQTHLSNKHFLEFLSQSKVAYKDNSIVNDAIKRITLTENEINESIDECIKPKFIIVNNQSIFYNFSDDTKLYDKYDISDFFGLAINDTDKANISQINIDADTDKCIKMYVPEWKENNDALDGTIDQKNAILNGIENIVRIYNDDDEIVLIGNVVFDNDKLTQFITIIKMKSVIHFQLYNSMYPEDNHLPVSARNLLSLIDPDIRDKIKIVMYMFSFSSAIVKVKFFF